VVGVLLALSERARSGLGQGVDCSVQAAVLGASLPATLNPPAGLPTARRSGGGVFLGTLQVRWVYPATDGHVVVSLLFGPMGGPFTRRLIEWMHEEGRCRDDTLKRDYVEFALKIQQGEYTLDEFAEIMDEVAAFTATKSKAELAAAASERALLIVPVANLDDVLASPQLAARGYWEEIGGVRHPGAMVKASATPLAPLGPAPDAPDAGRAALVPRRRNGRAPAAVEPSAPADKPLAGVNVADLAWVAAMPLATRVLAHWGATVVRIESEHRPDILRAALGHRDDIPEQENAITWHVANAGKMGVALNLARPEAREVVKDLARWADVVTESFTPGTLASLGLGYEQL
jgi:crotonobetainyl-CoA:carnitine CoA-transferase CaiB-like acyl-CoA transferase